MSSRSTPHEIVERNIQRPRYLNDRREAGIKRTPRLDHRDEGRRETGSPRELAPAEPLCDPQAPNSVAEPDHAQMIRRAQKFMQELSSTFALMRGEIRLGEQVKKLRAARNLTQEELAEALRASGFKKRMHRNTITNIELGKGETSFAVVAALADFFGVSLDELVFGISSTSMTREVLEKLDEISRRLDRPEKSTVRPTAPLLPPKT